MPPLSSFQGNRTGTFTYTIPGLQAGGAYLTVVLFFADTHAHPVGQRAFNVSLNYTPVLGNFDIRVVGQCRHRLDRKNVAI